jgi:hypothetical protein
MCVCARAHARAYINISATVHCCIYVGLFAFLGGHRLFSLVLLVLNAAFIRSTNPCLCQTDPQPKSSRVAAESGGGWKQHIKEMATHWYTEH